MRRSALIITKPLFAIAIVIGGSLLAGKVQAEVAPPITVTVPFTFSVDSQNLAAGTYQLEWLSEWIMSMRNLNGGREQMFMVRPEQGGTPEQNGCMIFQRFEGRSYLAEVSGPETKMHSELTRHHGTKISEAKVCSLGDPTSAALRKIALGDTAKLRYADAEVQ